MAVVYVPSWTIVVDDSVMSESDQSSPRETSFRTNSWWKTQQIPRVLTGTYCEYTCVDLLCGMYMYSYCLLPLITCTSTLFLCLLINFVPIFVFLHSLHPVIQHLLMDLCIFSPIYRFINLFTFLCFVYLIYLIYIHPSIARSVQSKPSQSNLNQSNLIYLFISVSVFQYELSWTCAQIIAIESC